MPMMPGRLDHRLPGFATELLGGPRQLTSLLLSESHSLPLGKDTDNERALAYLAENTCQASL